VFEGEINLELALTFDIILKYTRTQYYALCNGVLHVSKFDLNICKTKNILIIAASFQYMDVC
jgi:hypothetical protein